MKAKEIVYSPKAKRSTFFKNLVQLEFYGRTKAMVFQNLFLLQLESSFVGKLDGETTG